jgi:hypothetical protein
MQKRAKNQLLAGGAGHVAALGSRATHRRRLRHLDGLGL